MPNARDILPARHAEVLQMYDKVMIKFKEEQLVYKEKMDVLTGGVCKGIFPISIIKNADQVTGFYVTSGYKRLSECDGLSAEKILTIMEKTVSAMEECNEYLIFPEEFVITLDTAYIKENFEKVKFTYIPDKNGTGASKKLMCFAKELKSITTESGKLYLDMLSQLFATENLSILKVKALIAQLIREVNLCHIV